MSAAGLSSPTNVDWYKYHHIEICLARVIRLEFQANIAKLGSTLVDSPLDDEKQVVGDNTQKVVLYLGFLL